jgi:AraC-like DNA-binding protein
MAKDDSARWLRTGERARCALGAVTQTGLLIKRQPWAGFEHGYRYFGRFAIVLLVEGTGLYQDERSPTVRELSPGDVTIVLPDVGHRYGPAPGGESREMFIVFDGPVFDQGYAAGVRRGDRLIVSTGSPDHWAQRMRSVIEPGAATESEALREVCRLQHLLGDLLADAAGLNRAAARSPWLQRAIVHIQSTIPGPVDWDDIAEAMHVSLSTLRRRFRVGLGTSPNRYRNRILVDRACELMQTTDLTDQQIADRLGFCDGFYFSRVFKKVLGCSPRAYRGSLP